MKLLFLLVKDPLVIARAEVLALAGKPLSAANTGRPPLTGRSNSSNEELLVIDTSTRFIQRLAYTRAVYQLLFECEKDDLFFKTIKQNWNKVYEKDFAVRCDGNLPKEKELADLLGQKLKHPKVNLTNPTTTFAFFERNNKVYATKLIYENRENFNIRKNQFRPAPHPSSMDPRLARAMVNLSGIKSGTLIDPFCGSGGILIEAALMGLKAKGGDLDPDMIERSKKNLTYLNQKAVLEVKDALTLKKQIKYIATDLPYGKNTKASDVKPLYEAFFSILKNHLSKTAVIGLPDFVNGEGLIKTAGLKIKGKFIERLHKSLEKHIFVVTN